MSVPHAATCAPLSAGCARQPSAELQGLALQLVAEPPGGAPGRTPPCRGRRRRRMKIKFAWGGPTFNKNVMQQMS